MEEEEFLLQMNHISKSFHGIAALNDVSLHIKKGEVHALMGENGAGKSTLMKVLIGIYKPDEGEILFKGKRLQFNQPKEALDTGISMIHQELNPVLQMTIAENIFLGREPCGFLGVVNRKELRRKTRALFEDIGFDMDPDAQMSSLSMAEMQIVEIVKALSYQSDLIIMDEPTSAITDREVEKLFEVIQKLTARGKSIIYISHKMDEIFAISHSVTVFRDGKFVGTKPIGQLNKNLLISMMVGRELSAIYPKEQTAFGEVVLQVKGLSRKGKFHPTDFEIRKGEILGFSGLMGAGRTEVAESLFGIYPYDAGEVHIRNRKVQIRSPKHAIQQGMALVSEDRKYVGLNLKDSVKHNMTIANLKEYCKFGTLVNVSLENKVADNQIRLLNVKTNSRNKIVNDLSGGNQQKVVIAKWLLLDPDILILDEPTRGIDVGAKAEIYNIIGQLAKAGKAILMISSEMQELLGMCDRIAVFHEGRITGEFTREEFDQENIMACATGHGKAEVVAP